MADIQITCEKEINELHNFFVEWFNGTIDELDENFFRFKKVINEKFSLISPNGEQFSKERIQALVKESYGVHQEMEPSFQIWIENFNLEYTDKEIILATYEEWQNVGGKTSARISSVLFQRKKGKPNGLVWVHVHETWLPGKNTAAT